MDSKELIRDNISLFHILIIDTRKEAVDGIKYQCLISGYDPEKDEFGEYNEETSVFNSDNKNGREISWGTE